MSERRAILVAMSLICAFVLASVERLGAQEGLVIADLTGRLDLTPKDIAILLTGRGTPGIAITVPFASGRASISPQATQNLNSLGQVIQSEEFARDRFQIVGHTDSIGSRAANQRLSERRANSVKQYLVRNFRISPERLPTEGRGEDDPVPNTDDNTPEGRQKNRRVVVVNLGTR